ncbi:hypothetical protein CRG98_046313 [Punica granatum]|uniref:Uncharacterized protein n=1 Tax=Punica granatum TaxID=22663 RepID=A0A2I0HNJ6_PUNGR|nr:hypothetical protein CRG98_046313 [Punica granatum]
MEAASDLDGVVRDWGHHLAIPTPPPKSPIPMEDADDLGGEVRVIDWWPQATNRLGIPTWSPLSIRSWGRQLATSTHPPRLLVLTEDAGNLGESVTPTHPSFSIFFLELK